MKYWFKLAGHSHQVWFGWDWCNLEAKNKNFHFCTEIQDGCHEIFVQKYELQTYLVISAKLGFAEIGLRGKFELKSTEIQNCHH